MWFMNGYFWLRKWYDQDVNNYSIWHCGSSVTIFFNEGGFLFMKKKDACMVSKRQW